MTVSGGGQLDAVAIDGGQFSERTLERVLVPAQCEVLTGHLKGRSSLGARRVRGARPHPFRASRLIGAAAATLTASQFAIPETSARDLSSELTWRAHITDASGAPAEGAKVKFFVRPLDPNATGLIPLGQGVTDQKGQVAIPANPNLLRPYVVTGNLADVVVMASRDGGSKGFELSPPLVTTVDLGTEGDPAQVDILGASGEGDADDTLELSMDMSPAAGRNGSNSVSAQAAVTCYTELYFHESVQLDDTQVAIGQALIASGASAWRTDITYRNTHTTSIGTGISYTAGAGPLTFGHTGTGVTRESSASVTATGTYQGQAGSPTNRRQVITTDHRADIYKCWTNNSPPPGNPNSWPIAVIETIPGTWQRDYYGQNLDTKVALPACPENHKSLHGQGSLERTVGTRYSVQNSFGASVNYQGMYGTFNGGVQVNITKSTGKEVTQSWTNSSTSVLSLCAPDVANWLTATGHIGPVIAGL